MKVTFECIWTTSSGQRPYIPEELWSFDPINQVIRSAKCDAALLPFSLKLRETLSYEGVSSPSPLVTSSSFISMHEVEVVDESMFDEPCLLEVRATPEDDPIEEQKRQDIKQILSEFPNLFSFGKDDLGRISNPDIYHKINLLPDSVPPTRLRSMSSYSEHEREIMM